MAQRIFRGQINGQCQTQTASCELNPWTVRVIIPLANRKQANRSVIQANLSDIKVNLSDIPGNPSADQANQSANFNSDKP